MKQILQSIVPSSEERVQFHKVAGTVVARLNKNLENATAILGGSGAKDTWLAKSHDIDIFVQFDKEWYGAKSVQLADILEKSIKKSFPKTTYDRLHGSRDYFQLTYKGYTLELVPIIKITKAQGALNITDVSPLHTKWVNKQSQKIKNEIRLAKQFCKANKLYGAESYITGFSGYIIEILVVYYGSFEKLLKASVKWKQQEVIDVEKYYKNGKMALFHLNQSKTHSPLIIIDPVDKTRNAAAALGGEKFTLFKKIAARYLTKKEVSFFTKKEITEEKLQKQKGKNYLIMLTITSKKGKRDVVGMKLLKAFKHIKKSLEPFYVSKAGWQWNPGEKALFYYYIKKDTQPSTVTRQGPPLTMKEHVTNFTKKNKDTFTKNKRIYARVNVKHPKLDQFMRALLTQNYILEKIHSVSLTIR